MLVCFPLCCGSPTRALNGRQQDVDIASFGSGAVSLTLELLGSSSRSWPGRCWFADGGRLVLVLVCSSWSFLARGSVRLLRSWVLHLGAEGGWMEVVGGV